MKTINFPNLIDTKTQQIVSVEVDDDFDDSVMTEWGLKGKLAAQNMKEMLDLDNPTFANKEY